MVIQMVKCDRCSAEIKPGVKFIRIVENRNMIALCKNDSVMQVEAEDVHLCSPGCAALYFNSAMTEMWKQDKTGHVA